MNIVDLIVLLLVAGLLFLALRYTVKKAKRGECAGCSGCGGACGCSACHAQKKAK